MLRFSRVVGAAQARNRQCCKGSNEVQRFWCMIVLMRRCRGSCCAAQEQRCRSRGAKVVLILQRYSRGRGSTEVQAGADRGAKCKGGAKV